MARAEKSIIDSKRKNIFNTIVNDLLETSSESEDEIYHLLAENSDSDDDTLLERIVKRCKTTNISKDYMKEVLPEYTAEEFIKEFPISKKLFDDLVRKYELSDAYAYLRPDKRLPAALNLSVFLWFAGHENCSFNDLSERFNLPKSSISRVIYRIIDFLQGMKDEVIKWPKPMEKQKSAHFFGSKFGFSKAMGCIDVSHIGIYIHLPPHSCGDYVNPKGNVTLCMQAVCDERNRFIDVFVKHPGSTHPNQILYNSPIYENISTLCEDYYLLGAACYPCSDWIITPFKCDDEVKSYDKYFNLQHMQAHDIIRCSFCMLKQRFKQLKYCKLRSLEKLGNFVEACCILHNLSLGDNLLDITNVTDDGYINNVESIEPDINDRTRMLICEEICKKISNSEVA
ncbi:putative nuclease HARBI1 [Eurosta solidaginis]|uniref:putative nuclease HARBI1 n=1 Tax=Eurosta solidaginis TaxID=178769 RepID=UPI003531460B